MNHQASDRHAGKPATRPQMLLAYQRGTYSLEDSEHLVMVYLFGFE